MRIIKWAHRLNVCACERERARARFGFLCYSGHYFHTISIIRTFNFTKEFHSIGVVKKNAEYCDFDHLICMLYIIYANVDSFMKSILFIKWLKHSHSHWHIHMTHMHDLQSPLLSWCTFTGGDGVDWLAQLAMQIWYVNKTKWEMLNVTSRRSNW